MSVQRSSIAFIVTGIVLAVAAAVIYSIGSLPGKEANPCEMSRQNGSRGDSSGCRPMARVITSADSPGQAPGHNPTL